MADVELLLVCGAWALGSLAVSFGLGAVVARAERAQRADAAPAATAPALAGTAAATPGTPVAAAGPAVA